MAGMEFKAGVRATESEIMTPKEQAEVIRRARQDAQAVLAWWPYRGCPYHTQEEIDLYEEHFQAAMKEARR